MNGRSSAFHAMPRPKTRVVGIDYMRLFAAFSVMLYHYGYYFGLAGGVFGAKVPSFPSLNFAWFGWIGVEIFFVISGYVITYSAAASGPYQFVRGRVKRIWPGVLLCGTISALVACFIPHTPFGLIMASYARALTLSPKGPWIDGVYWTLVIEIIFYACIYVALRLRGTKGLRVVAAALTLWSGLYWIATSLNSTMHTHASDYVFGVLLLRHGCLFAFGMYIYFLQVNSKDMVSSTFASLALVSCMHEILQQATPAAAIAHSDFVMLPLLIWSSCVLFMLVAAWCNFAKARNDSRSDGVAQALGRMTYPVYLLHGTIGSVLLPLLPHLLAVPACVILVLTLSGLITCGPEQFLAAKLGKLLDRARDFIQNPPDGTVPSAAE